MQVFQTSVDELGLVSLRDVRNGHIYIANNSRLCYVSSVNWHNISVSTKQNVLIQYNRNQSECGKLNLDLVWFSVVTAVIIRLHHSTTYVDVVYCY